MMKITTIYRAVGLGLCLQVGMAGGAVSEKQAERLGKDLTPVGAEAKGNAAGTIPAWQPLLKKDFPSAYKRGAGRLPNPYAGEKPLFTIDAGNYQKYTKQLTEGQIALFKAYPDTFSMRIYPSHRNASYPERLYQNTRLAATQAQLAEGGNGFTGVTGGYPFPIPQSGKEALWNHIVRYRGTYLTRRFSEVAVQRNGRYSLITAEQEAYFKYYDPKVASKDLNNILFYYISLTRSPARLAGGAVLVHETLNQVKQARKAWGYNAGQRRVRRAPNLVYDTPISSAEGLRTADDTDMYNGAPDRYNWKIVGKKEVYIPYNNYDLISDQISYKDVLATGHINPAHARYELHRVWVLEATLKPDGRHIYSKRVLYLDEDSWGAAVVDQYDTRGDLWRVSMAYLINVYDLPSVLTTLDVYHDLQARRYHVLGLTNEEDLFMDYSKPPPSENYFTASALRRRGRR